MKNIQSAKTAKAIARLLNSMTVLFSLLVLVTSVAAFTNQAASAEQTSQPDAKTVTEVTNSLPNPLQEAVAKLRRCSNSRHTVFKVDEAAISTTAAPGDMPVLDRRVDSYLKLSSSYKEITRSHTKIHKSHVTFSLNTEVVSKRDLRPGHVGLQGLALASDGDWAKMPIELKTAIKSMQADGYTVHKGTIDSVVVLQKVLPVKSQSRFDSFLLVRMIGIDYSSKMHDEQN